MKSRFLPLALGIAACILFFSVSTASAYGHDHGRGFSYGSRGGFVSIQIGSGGCGHYRPAPVIVVPSRSYSYGRYHTPSYYYQNRYHHHHGHHHGGYYRW